MYTSLFLTVFGQIVFQFPVILDCNREIYAEHGAFRTEHSATNLPISSPVWQIISMSLSCLEDFHSLRCSVLFSGIFVRSLRLF